MMTLSISSAWRKTMHEAALSLSMIRVLVGMIEWCSGMPSIGFDAMMLQWAGQSLLHVV